MLIDRPLNSATPLIGTTVVGKRTALAIAPVPVPAPASGPAPAVPALRPGVYPLPPPGYAMQPGAHLGYMVVPSEMDWDLGRPIPPGFQADTRVRLGYVIDEAEVTFWGLCPACQASVAQADEVKQPLAYR